MSTSAATDPDAVIHTEDLTKIYPGTDFAAVDKLNLDVQTGEIFGLLGPNGAGKTTTAGMLTTRVVPSSGRAFLAGVDVAAPVGESTTGDLRDAGEEVAMGLI